MITELQDARLVVEPPVDAVPRSAGDRPPAGARRARPRGRRRRSGSTSASATCASRSPTSPTACSPSATSRSDADLPAAEAIALAARLVGEVLDEAGARGAEIAGVGMGLPGPVHRPTGELGDSTILPGWVGVRAADAMSEALGHPVEVENDASLGALSEWMWGAGRGADDIAYLKLATGIGAGLIVRGRPYGGSGGTAGEIGHTIIAPDGPICRCGNRGCLETLAGSDGDPRLAARHARGAHAARRDRRRARRPRGLRGGRSATPAPRSAARSRRSATCSTRSGSSSAATSRPRASCCSSRSPPHCAAAPSAPRPTTSTVLPGALGDRAEVLGAVALVLRRGAGLLPRAGGA